MPPSANSKRPNLLCNAPVKAPFSWPNSSEAIEIARNCRAIHTYEGTRRPRRAFVNRPRDEFLACASFTGDENCGIAWSNFCDANEDRLKSRRGWPRFTSSNMDVLSISSRSAMFSHFVSLLRPLLHRQCLFEHRTSGLYVLVRREADSADTKTSGNPHSAGAFGLPSQRLRRA